MGMERKRNTMQSEIWTQFTLTEYEESHENSPAKFLIQQSKLERV
jgi:hypothetical protein